ncbi:hypothetical protein MMC10_007277 [Thelotrema lepadinum]|nr:hypothetical protein [Thelotrema lepadinum]
MTFSQENGYDEVLNTLKETGVYVKSKSDLPQETAHHSLYRPSTASTNTTYQSGTTGASSSTNETAYSTNTGPLVPQYGLLHQQRPFSSSEPSNATLVPQSRMFPRPTLTTSIIPGPSIPESIISRPNGWANQTTVTPFGPLIAYRGDSNFVHYTPSLPTFPRPSQPHSSEEKDSLPRSLFSNGSGTQHLDLRMTLAELNQLEPPPKRKLPFTDSPELDENQSREKAVEPAVKRIRSKRTTAPNESKSYNLREKEEELDSDRGGSSLAPLNEPAAAKKTRKQTQVKATKNTAALGQDGNSKRKAAVKKDHPPTNAPRKRTMKVSASKNPETEVDAPKSKSLRARPPPKKEPSNKAALAKKPSLKSVSKEAFPTYASIGTQTESPQSKKTPVYTSRATQTQSPTMGGNVIYRSRSTQTSTPEQVTPELPLQQRPASAILSPNAVASIETPSRTERRRAPPVNKFTRPREVVNRFTPHPHLAAIQRRRASATGSSPLRRARPL